MVVTIPFLRNEAGNETSIFVCMYAKRFIVYLSGSIGTGENVCIHVYTQECDRLLSPCRQHVQDRVMRLAREQGVLQTV